MMEMMDMGTTRRPNMFIGILLFLLVGAIFFGGGIACGYGSRNMQEEQARYTGSVQGKVTNVTSQVKTTRVNKKKRTKRHYTSYFTYTVDGKEYSGTMKRKSTQGAAIEINYIPDKPEEYITPADKTNIKALNIGKWVFMAVGAVIPIAGIVSLIGQRRRRG